MNGSSEVKPISKILPQEHYFLAFVVSSHGGQEPNVMKKEFSAEPEPVLTAAFPEKLITGIAVLLSLYCCFPVQKQLQIHQY